MFTYLYKPWIETLPSVLLRDDGSGDPDLVADDGLYSRYLVEVGHWPGVLSLGVRLSDGDNRAVVAGAGDYPGQCCGSTTGVNTDTALRTGAFSRVISEAASVHLLEVPDVGIIDKIPPARIGDLRVLPSSRYNTMKIKFTAPGDDFDHGETDEIIVVTDTAKTSLMQGWAETQILTRFKSLRLAGETVIQQLLLPHESRNDIYVGVVGRDEAGNTGIISNIVHCRVTGPQTVSNTDDDNVRGHQVVVSDAPSDEDIGVDREWLLILALCSSFFLMSLCLLGGVLYFLRCARPWKPAMVDIGVSDDVTEPDNVSHCSSEIRNMTQFPGLLDVTDLMGARPSHVSSYTCLDTCHTPSYWSASQLLGEHDARSGRIFCERKHIKGKGLK